MHIVNILFVTYTTSFIYYTVVSLAFVRMIELFLRQRTVDYFEDLYSKIGVKWSFKKMWYVDEVVYSNPLEKSLKMFEEINRWIIKDKPFSNPDFSFKDVSKQFDGMSYRDLCAILDEANGLTFQSYIRECRISEAISLMEPSASGGNDYTLKEIAFMVGFESSSSFSRSFKAVKNVSATEWRKRK